MEVSDGASWMIVEEPDGMMPQTTDVQHAPPAWLNFDAEELFSGHHKVDTFTPPGDPAESRPPWELAPEPQPVARSSPKRAKPMPLRKIAKLKRSHSSTSHANHAMMMASSPFGIMGSPSALELVASHPHEERWSMTQSEDHSWLSGTTSLYSATLSSPGASFYTRDVESGGGGEPAAAMPDNAAESTAPADAKPKIGRAVAGHKMLQNGPVQVAGKEAVEREISLDEVIKAASVRML